MKTTELDIGMLCQWLNEDRITDSKKMVNSESVKYMLGINKYLYNNDKPKKNTTGKESNTHKTSR